MRPMCLGPLLALALCASLLPSPEEAAAAVQAPVLKWQRGGCYPSWCETGWYSSPAVADLDGDSAPEVLGASYTVFALNGSNGSVKWSLDPPGGRSWPGVAAGDIDADSDLEIVTAHGNGYVHVFDHTGSLDGSRRPTTSELRGLALQDLDNDGTLEIIVSAAIGSAVNTWIYEHDGTVRAGWPQLDNTSGYAAGVYNENAAAGDLDLDGLGEIVVPSDVHYICAYEADGAQIPANAVYGGRGWGKVGVWESPVPELRGWGECSGAREERYRTNFAHGAAVIADMDGDAVPEVVVTGNVYDCEVGHPPGRYNGVYVFNADRSRFDAGAYDWTYPPVDTGAPLTEDYDVIENNLPNPAVADLDGDGEREIVFSSYDGRVHAFWLDRTERHNWPFAVYHASEGFYRFAGEPAIADLDADGRAEVIAASWAEKGTNAPGRLHILDYQGNALHEIDLPPPFGGEDWNGALAGPTLADIDQDADLEVVLNTAHSGFVAYDLPGTADAVVLWGTGSGNYQRNGFVQDLGLKASTKAVEPASTHGGGSLTYTITVVNRGPSLAAAHVSDPLPPEVAFAGSLSCSSGICSESSGTVTWDGPLAPGATMTLTFAATVSASVTTPAAIVNTARIDDGRGNAIDRTATAMANAISVFLPLAQHGP